MANVSFLQWNARSIKTNKGYLEKFLYDNKIDIGLISETWLKKSNFINFTGYNVFRNDRDDGYGGVAILLKKLIKFYNSPTFHQINDIMCNSISIKIQSGKKLNIYSIYVKPNLKITLNEWKKFFNSLEKPFIIGGDFNSHNYVWGCSTVDTIGKIC